MKSNQHTKRIARVESTNETLTGRGGLALFARYLRATNVLSLLQEAFGHLRKSQKGQPIRELFLQVFCFLMDGTSRHLSYFDELADDEGYAGILETSPRRLASSHTMKRFFKSFSWLAAGPFRKILNRLFVWRLKIKRPREVQISIDTMVMDNDEALKREGVQPTYKKVKGFQPLQMIWNGKIVDAVFRGGKKHSNCGNTVVNMISRMVPLIRQACGEKVLIVLRLDAGFFDEEILDACSEHELAFILSGKMYESVKDYVGSQARGSWGEYHNGDQLWEYVEFGWRCESWRRLYRAFYTRAVREDGQMLMEFARPDNVILTNLGIDPEVLEHCTPRQRQHWLRPETIIASHHGRGADELPHRGLKDFGFEQLPFRRFVPNMVVYYCMLIAFFLHETFKEDALADVIPVTAYPTTVRRKLIDVAAKIVRKSGQVILKVTKATMESLRFDELWERCQNPPPIPSGAL